MKNSFVRYDDDDDDDNNNVVGDDDIVSEIFGSDRFQTDDGKHEAANCFLKLTIFNLSAALLIECE